MLGYVCRTSIIRSKNIIWQSELNTCNLKVIVKLNLILQKTKHDKDDPARTQCERLVAGCSFKQGKEKNCGKKVPNERGKKGKVLSQKCQWAGGMSIRTGDWRRKKTKHTGCICINKPDHQFTLEREQKGQEALQAKAPILVTAGNSLGMHTGLLDCGHRPNHWSHPQTALQSLGGTARERLPTPQPSFFPYMLHKHGENNHDPASCTKTLHRRPVALGC